MRGEIHVGERAPEHAPTCPYCHAEIAADDVHVWTCPSCSTRHHDGCARENGGCTLLGCGAVHPRPLPAPPRPRARPPGNEVIVPPGPPRAPPLHERLHLASYVIASAGLGAAALGIVLLTAASGILSTRVAETVALGGGALVALGGAIRAAAGIARTLVEDAHGRWKVGVGGAAAASCAAGVWLIWASRQSVLAWGLGWDWAGGFLVGAFFAFVAAIVLFAMLAFTRPR